ncbi:hypothetical protein [Nocardia tengchongensis]|uniref:hypothetical protein n=1 Tax=Nocardia tengchongensis TaxID=2055889 RepID=UPI00361E0AE7
MQFEINDLGRRADNSVFGPKLDGWEATVKFDSGEILRLSQLDGEAPRWAVDAAFGANGHPHWVNGFGNRTGKFRAAADPLRDALNARRDEIAARA